MAKFVLAYSGGGPMPETEEEIAATMEAWGAWFGSMGEAVIDGGNPFGASSSIAPDGTVSAGGTTRLNGFSVISADSLDAAQDMAKGCPVLANDGTVDVYEAMDM